MIKCRYHMLLPPLIVWASTLVGVAGCGNGHPVAQVRGKVVFKNGEMPRTSVRYIRFECAADTDAAVRKGASGAIEDDGSFELFTRRPGDGVHYGKYAVTFAIQPGPMDRRSLVPAKYTSAATTPYQIIVDKDLNSLEFEIDQGGATTSPRKN
jgi:hypothetical protein